MRLSTDLSAKSNRNGCEPRWVLPISSCLSRPCRATASTLARRRMMAASSGSSASGRRSCSVSSPPVGQCSAGPGGCTPAAWRCAIIRDDMFIDQGVNSRMWLHAVTFAATEAADSYTVQGQPLSRQANAASRPIGPAPRIATRPGPSVT